MSIEPSKNPRDIILAPVVSEKSYNLIDEGGEGNYLLKSGDTIVVP